MLLELKNINKNYGKTIALKDLSLTARSGEILGVIGPNGAGKSTMIKFFLERKLIMKVSYYLTVNHWKEVK